MPPCWQARESLMPAEKFLHVRGVDCSRGSVLWDGQKKLAELSVLLLHCIPGNLWIALWHKKADRNPRCSAQSPIMRPFGWHISVSTDWSLLYVLWHGDAYCLLVCFSPWCNTLYRIFTTPLLRSAVIDEHSVIHCGGCIYSGTVFLLGCWLWLRDKFQCNRRPVWSLPGRWLYLSYSEEDV